MKRLLKIMWRGIIDLLTYFIKWFGYRNRLEGKVDVLMRRIIRLEISEAIKRKDTQTVCDLFDEYKQLGGNSYMTHVVEQYIKQSKRSKK
jgi:hypothetical protein